MLIAVPYHLDERLPDLPVPADTVVELPQAAGAGWEPIAALATRVATAVEEAAGEPVVVCMGDCTTGLGVLAGLQRARPDVSVVWFDAHGDFNTDETTPSGYLGGMPLAVACGLGDQTVPQAVGLLPLRGDRVLLVGARDVDPGEDELLEAERVRRSTVAALTVRALPDGPIYLHVDLDVVAADAVAGLVFRYPAAGGPDLDGVCEALRTVLATGRVGGVGLALTWDPGRSSRAAGSAVARAALAATA